MRKLTPLLLLAAFALAGCRAEMMETRGKDLRLTDLLGRTEKQGKGGVVRWLSNGPKAFKDARRADAEKQMRKFCGGGYTVTAEGPRSKLGASVPIAKKSALEMDEYWYQAFDCAAGG